MDKRRVGTESSEGNDATLGLQGYETADNQTLFIGSSFSLEGIRRPTHIRFFCSGRGSDSLSLKKNVTSPDFVINCNSHCLVRLGRELERGERIMKAKNLRKKIRRLEKRLHEGPQKLAKLKQKLQAVEATRVAKGKKKAAARAAAKLSKPDKAKKSGAVKKPKKKLNLSPERRAQLAAAMKARWAAKRAAEANAKGVSGDNQHSAPPGPTPQPPEHRPDGV
jgi:hypothetical protein